MAAAAGTRTPSKPAILVALLVLAGLYGAKAVWGDDLELRNSGPVAALFAVAFLGLAVWFVLRRR
jgi:hypothetical protein